MNELFFISLYLLCFSSPDSTQSLLLPTEDFRLAMLLPLAEIRSLFAFAPAKKASAAAMELARANKVNDRIPRILVGLSAPLMFCKQAVNVVQLWTAAEWLVEGDRWERRMRRRAARDEAEERKARGGSVEESSGDREKVE